MLLFSLLFSFVLHVIIEMTKMHRNYAAIVTTPFPFYLWERVPNAFRVLQPFHCKKVPDFVTEFWPRRSTFH